MSTAIIYARFSPRRHADQSESIEAQVEACKRYCAQHGYDVADQFEDREVSGSTEIDQRPGLWAACEAITKGTVLIAHKQDRLARSVYVHECIKRQVANRGGSIEIVEGVSNGDTPEDELIRGILASFAEYERKVIAARTHYAMQRHQRSGRRMGRRDRVPFGMMIDSGDPSRLVMNPSEQHTIREIVAMHDRGLNTYQITEELNDSGTPGRGASKWYYSTVKRILEREGALAC